MRTIPLLLLLVSALSVSPATANIITFRKLSRRLTRLRTPQICLSRKITDLELFGRQLRLARSCLPFDERMKLRVLCRRKSNTMEARAACARIDACPKTRKIKQAIEEAEMRSCPPLSPRFSRVEKRWRRRLNRRIRKAGLLDPIYDTIVLESRRKKATSAVVLLHGLGESAKDRLPLAEEIQNTLPSTRVILPQAPEQFVKFLNETRASWFDIAGTSFEMREAREGILSAAGAIDAIGDVQRVVYGLPRDKVAIVGVSQGGAVALTTYLRHKWGAAIGLTTFLPLPDSYPKELGNGTVDVELLMLHGRTDMIVPFQVGESARDVILGFGRKVRFVELEGNHFLPFEQDTVEEEIARQLKAAFS